MLILGLDPGSVRFGYGLIDADGERMTYVEAGVLSAPEGWNKYKRLGEIGRELEALIDEYLSGLAAVALEAGFVSPQRGKLQQGALVSAASRGVAGYVAARANVPVFEYANNTVKLAVAGHGRADKALVSKMVRVVLGMKRDPSSDAGDALALAICHARQAASGTRARAA